MDVIGFADVDDDGLTAIGNSRLGERLGLAQFRPRAFSWLGFFGHEVGELHPIKREVTLFPEVPPMRNHEREKRPVFMGASGIGFPLIPDDAAEAVTYG